MRSITSRPFAVWATRFRRNPFFRARWKLTAYYCLGIVGILLVFNLAVYEIFVSNAFDAIKYGSAGLLPSEAVEVAIIEQAEDRLENVLYLVDACILILVPLLSYALAGKTLRPIEAMHQRQKKFLADAAHELRTPLAVMKAGTEATLIGAGPVAEYEKFLSESLEEIDHLSVLVDDLLFLAHADSGHSSPLIPVRLVPLVQSEVEQMRPYAKTKGISLEMDIDTKDMLALQGNPIALRRLITNLTGNAIEHNRPGGTVTVELKRLGERIELAVSDTGVGIAPSDLPHIFERFYKADPARIRMATETTGVGLGLSIVQEIAEFHSATIDVHSASGTGTTFTVVFPPAS
ncbi:MAG: ATP-binding protein [Candidatus Moraniibacteriota bacterium]